MLLPHGMEGQGPEHSNARLERFLNLCVNDNMQVCNLTTPAQYFHALRRQVLRPYRKPLIIMSPKSLLRHPAATSPLSDFTDGRLPAHHPRPDGRATRRRSSASCSAPGKVYYDLVAAREERRLRRRRHRARRAALPAAQGRAARGAVASIADGTPVVWVQEEPKNMGAWAYMNRELPALLAGSFPWSCVSRPLSASPATGSAKRHTREQARLMADAFGKGTLVRWRSTLRVPALGESIREATLGAWKHAEGDEVAADEPLVEVESEKATLEVPSPGRRRAAQDPAQGGRDRRGRRGDRRDRSDRRRRADGRRRLGAPAARRPRRRAATPATAAAVRSRAPVGAPGAGGERALAPTRSRGAGAAAGSRSRTSTARSQARGETRRRAPRSPRSRRRRPRAGAASRRRRPRSAGAGGRRRARARGADVAAAPDGRAPPGRGAARPRRSSRPSTRST